MQNMIETLGVALGDRSYPIHIGTGLLKRLDLILPHIKQKKVVVVTNTTVAPLYLAMLRSTLESGGISVLPVVLPDGEQFKTWETLNQIFDALLGSRCERGTTLISLGGGVIGDMGGFAGRLLCWWQDRHQSSARQEHDWRVLSAEAGSG